MKVFMDGKGACERPLDMKESPGDKLRRRECCQELERVCNYKSLHIDSSPIDYRIAVQLHVAKTL